MEKISGIYQIRNIVNNKIYVGSGADLFRRKRQHFYELRKGRHNKHLQRSFNKYGEEKFVFEIIEYIDNVNDLLDHENYWIKKLKANNPEFGYNARAIAQNNLGLKHTKETKEKLSKIFIGRPSGNFGRKHSEESRRKMSKTRMNISVETRDKLSLSHIGIFPSDITKEKMSIAHSGENNPSFGKPKSEDEKQKLSNARIGMKMRGSSSKYIGVSLDSITGKWSARIYKNRIYSENIYIGQFETETEAGMAYNEICSEFYGYKAKLNIISQEEIDTLWEMDI